jgi:Zc3h12a-like Ribonuclease NYN domain
MSSSQSRPSARPRLVEEGEPIYAAASSSGGQQSQDIDINDDYEMSFNGSSGHNTSHYSQNHQQSQRQHQQQKSSLQQAASSLQRAALQSNRSWKFNNYMYGDSGTTTSYTIIGGADQGSGSNCNAPHNTSSTTTTTSNTHHSVTIGGTAAHHDHITTTNNNNNLRRPSYQFTISSPTHSSMPLATMAQQQRRHDHHVDDDDTMMIDHEINDRQPHHHRHHHHEWNPNNTNVGYHTSSTNNTRRNSNSVTQTSFTIGGGPQQQPPSSLSYYQSDPYINEHHQTGVTSTSMTTAMADRMEGVEDHSEKSEIVVLDGANVAYAYGEANSTSTIQLSVVTTTNTNNNKKTEPDVRGIQVAADHFLKHGIRVLVVLPQYFWRSKPRPSMLETSSTMTQQLEILNDLKARGLLVPSPPADDDDAYAITIAKREDAKSQQYPERIAPGYVLSNDMFRDAQDRDTTGNLRRWLQDGRVPDFGPGRISYTFFDNQSMNDRGEHILDFQPNPRHPLVIRLEQQHHQQQ